MDVNLENPADNKDCYNMSFTLYLKGETEPLGGDRPYPAWGERPEAGVVPPSGGGGV